MLRKYHLLAVLAVSLLLLVALSSGAASTAAGRGTTDAVPSDLEAAFQLALDTYVTRLAPGCPLELGPAHRSGEWAYALAHCLDDSVLGQGPRLVAFLARKESGSSGWRVLAPGLCTAREYNALLAGIPGSLLDEGVRASLRLPDGFAALASYSGHRLPWPAGQLGYVTQLGASPHHANQVDFDILGLAGAGDVYASKPGTVVFVKQCSTYGACDSTGSGWQNVVVVQHDSGEYSWYVHLAHNSVPVKVGDRVDYGTKIGVEGDTGYTCGFGGGTGIHLHYMVSTDHTPWTDPLDPSVAPWAWGSIVPVDFHEVAWGEMVVMETYRSANERPPAPPIELAEALSVSPAMPLPGETVVAQFKMRNAGEQAVTLPALAALGRGPGCRDWECLNEADFPAVTEIVLEPGEEYTYRQERSFPAAGGGYLVAPAYRDQAGVWRTDLADAPSIRFAVGTPSRVYLPLVVAGGDVLAE